MYVSKDDKLSTQNILGLGVLVGGRLSSCLRQFKIGEQDKYMNRMALLIGEHDCHMSMACVYINIYHFNAG